MTSEDVVVVIDELCDKLGLAVSSFTELLPELVSMQVVCHAFWVVIYVIEILAFALVMRLLYRRAIKWTETETGISGLLTYDISDYVPFVIGACVGGCLTLFCVCFMLYDIAAIISWVTAPNVSAINYILSLVE